MDARTIFNVIAYQKHMDSRLVHAIPISSAIYGMYRHVQEAKSMYMACTRGHARFVSLIKNRSRSDQKVACKARGYKRSRHKKKQKKLSSITLLLTKLHEGPLTNRSTTVGLIRFFWHWLPLPSFWHPSLTRVNDFRNCASKCSC